MNTGLPDSIIGERGRALTPMFKNMPPEQQQAYINQQITNGNMDYLAAIALKGQYEALKRGEQPPPPTAPPITQLMRQAVMSGNAGIGGIPAPNALVSGQPQQPPQPPQPPPPQPQTAGVAGMPTGVMENADYARGGIVAFSGAANSFTGDTSGNIRSARHFPVPPSAAADLGADAATGAAEAGARMYTAEEIAAGFANAATPEEKSWWKKLGERVAKGAPGKAEEFLTKARGTGGLGALASRGAGVLLDAYPLAATFEGMKEGVNAVRGKAVPTENMYKYYGIDQPEYFNADGTPSVSAAMKDLGVRTLGEAQRVLTLGFGGPQDTKEPPATPVAPTTPAGLPSDFTLAAQPQEQGFDVSVPSVDEAGIKGIYAPAIKYFGDQAKKPVKTAEAYGDEYQQRLNKAGIGKTSAKRQQEISDELTNMPKERRREAWLNAAAGFFEGAQRASRGENTLGSFAAAAQTGLKGYGESVKELRAREDRLRDAQANLAMADEAVRMRVMDRGDADYKEAKTEVKAAETSLLTAQQGMGAALQSAKQHRGDQMVQLRIAQIQAATKGDPMDKILAPYYAEYNRYVGKNNLVAAQQVYNRIVEIVKTDPRVVASIVSNTMPPPPGGPSGANNADMKVVGYTPTGTKPTG